MALGTTVSMMLMAVVLATWRVASADDMKGARLPSRPRLKLPRGALVPFDGAYGNMPSRGSIVNGQFLPMKQNPRAITKGTPGNFSLYIFAMSWKAEWCYHQHYPGCKAPRDFWKDNLTVHGLWPDYGDGTYPTMCTSERFDHEKVIGAVGIDVLEDVWPNIQVSEDAGEKYDNFWKHEWSKHGTCSGLTQEEYFTAGVSLLQDRFTTPEKLREDKGSTISRVDLENAYGGGGMVVLECVGKSPKILSQVFLCLEVDSETHMPGDQIACPDEVFTKDDTCGRGIIHVNSF